MIERFWKGNIRQPKRGRRPTGGDLSHAPWQKSRVLEPPQRDRDKIKTLAELNKILWSSRKVGSLPGEK